MSDDPDVPGGRIVRFTGSRLAAWILKLIGWRHEFDGLPARQGVLVVYPHTSNWDFPVMILVKWAIGIPVRFWGKDTLFRVPVFGAWLRWLGGVPVSRTAPQGVVGEVVDLMREHIAQDAYFWLALAPEGTRKYIPGWRSGFYRVAVSAGVPLGVVTLDWSRRVVRAMDFIALSGDEAADMARIQALCGDARGRWPQAAAPVKLLDASVRRADTIVE